MDSTEPEFGTLNIKLYVISDDDGEEKDARSAL